jgi:hypothetical protein
METTEHGASASTRVSTAAAAGICAGALVALPASWQLGTLAGWDVAAGVYVAWTWATVWHRDPPRPRGWPCGRTRDGPSPTPWCWWPAWPVSWRSPW